MSGLVALRFNECITAADLAGLAALMSADHRFVDIEGNVFSAVVPRPGGVVLVGRSECPGHEVLTGPGPVDSHCCRGRGDRVAGPRGHPADPPCARASS
ncbi:MAG TPA: hypothetical protein VGD70_02355 [Actinophytocola sp.]